jgi:hypothetical protein
MWGRATVFAGLLVAWPNWPVGDLFFYSFKYICSVILGTKNTVLLIFSPNSMLISASLNCVVIYASQDSLIILFPF